jgi:glycosyltransferase involved in cell wall biosynthesis
MKIIFVMNAFHPIVGGVERAALQLARTLMSIECNVEVVTARNPLSLPGREVIDGIPVFRFPYYVYRDSFRSALASLIGMPLACLQLLVMAINRRPCIVHVHFLYHNAVCVAMIRGILARYGIPVVVTFHGGDAPNIPTSYLQNHRSESRILNWAALHLLHYANAMTAVSEARRSAIFDSIQDRTWPIEVIHNGVDTSLFAPLPSGLKNKAILAIGRLSYAKGYDILLEAFSGISARYPEWQLRIAGDGEERDSLEHLAKSLKIQERVNFLGMLTTRDLIAEINSSAFVVSTSRWEGFSLAALEAMACGRALITTDVPGAREMIINNVNGFIVSREDREELTSGIEILINEPLIREEMGKAARRHIVANFTWDKIAIQYKKLYETLLGH